MDVKEHIDKLETNADIVNLNLSSYPRINGSIMPGVTLCIITGGIPSVYYYRNLDTLALRTRANNYIGYAAPVTLMNTIINTDLLIYDEENDRVVNIIPLTVYPRKGANGDVEVLCQWKLTRSYTIKTYTLSTIIDTDININAINNPIVEVGCIAMFRTTFRIV